MKAKVFDKFTAEAAEIIFRGGIGVIPTDTIYGIICSALSRKAVQKVYRLRKRSPDKPVIVLIGSKSDIGIFGIGLGSRTSNILNKLWPGPVSVILPIANRKSQIEKFKHLHRGNKTLAFRLPADKKLRGFLKRTGPLIAPSANFEGEPPAADIKEAQKYFGDKINFYIDGGEIKSNSSTLAVVAGGKISVLRKGAGFSKLRDVSNR